MTKVTSHMSGQRIFKTINDVSTTGETSERRQSWHPTSHYTQRQTPC